VIRLGQSPHADERLAELRCVAPLTGDSRLQSDVLESLSDARRYRRWLADLALPFLGAHPIEIGSGNGDYALEWAPDVTGFTATEADEERYKALDERFRDHSAVDVRWLLLGDDNPPAGISVAPDRQHTAAVALNVFEHIPDHVRAMRSLAQFVQPGGHIVVIVPAFPSAMSRFDRAIGHQRRYTKAALTALFADAGLDVLQARYVNPIGLFVWYGAVRMLNMTPRNGPNLRLYDRTIVPIARALDRALPSGTPFGQAVFGVARVPH
jgi:SAM-dependent methyltransferase